MKKIGCFLSLLFVVFFNCTIISQSKVIYTEKPVISDVKVYNPDGTLHDENDLSGIVVKVGDTVVVTCQVSCSIEIKKVSIPGYSRGLTYDPESKLYTWTWKLSEFTKEDIYSLSYLTAENINGISSDSYNLFHYTIVYNSNCANGDHTLDISSSKYETIAPASCTEPGYQAKKCTICEKPVMETKKIIPAKGHQYLNWRINGIKGTAQRNCRRCHQWQTENFDLTATSLTMKKGKTTSSLKVSTSIKGDKATKWSSSNSKVVAVDKKTGKLTAKKAGTAKITVKMKSGITATCTVKVQKGDVKAKKISLNKTKLQLKKGKTFQLKVSREPFTVTEKLTFTSSNKKVVTVNSKGKITAKKKGTATITVKSGSKKVKCKVTVK